MLVFIRFVLVNQRVRYYGYKGKVELIEKQNDTLTIIISW